MLALAVIKELLKDFPLVEVLLNALSDIEVLQTTFTFKNPKSAKPNKTHGSQVDSSSLLNSTKVEDRPFVKLELSVFSMEYFIWKRIVKFISSGRKA